MHIYFFVKKIISILYCSYKNDLLVLYITAIEYVYDNDTNIHINFINSILVNSVRFSKDI